MSTEKNKKTKIKKGDFGYFKAEKKKLKKEILVILKQKKRNGFFIR